LRLARPIGGTRIAVVNESDAVPYENAGFDGDTFANKGVTADFTIIPDFCALLYFHKCPDPRLITDFATVQIYERMNPHVSTELHIRRDPAIVWKLLIDRSCSL
jgi:hypothetical protein